MFVYKVLFMFVLAVTLKWSVAINDLTRRTLFDDDLYQAVLDSELCNQHLQQMSRFEFFDASFRIPKGILTGNFLDFGNYMQCLGIRQQREDTFIEGKHCIINFQDVEQIVQLPLVPDEAKKELKFELESIQKIRNYVMVKRKSLMLPYIERTAATMILSPMRLGVCIPKSCTIEEGLAPYFNSTQGTINYVAENCRLPGDKPFVAVDYLAFVLFGLIILVTAASTTYDIHHVVILKKETTSINALYSSCSVLTNIKRLFTFKSTPGSLDCLDGIRSLAILWIIFGHTSLVMVMAGVTNNVEALQLITEPKGLWMTAAMLSVDTFLMLTGLLLVYIGITKMTQLRLLKTVHLFYLNRLLRLFPVLAAGILLQASVFHHLADGANWPFEGKYVQDCRTYWWAALLHIQNYYNPTEACLPQTWYLSVDTQLYVISPAVLFWMLGSRRSAWWSVSFAVLLSFVVTTVYCVLLVNDANHNTHYYWNTLTRAPPFFVGMLFGYILHVCRGQKIQLSKWLLVVFWVSSMVIFGCIIYASYPTNDPTNENEIFKALSRSFGKGLWAAALGWMVFACVHGYGGPINWFLCLRIWKYIARLSYSMYIFHHPIQFLSGGAMVAPRYHSFQYVVVKFVNELAFTMAISIVVCILIDAPFMTIQKLLLGGDSKTRKTNPKEISSTPARQLKSRL